MDKKRRVPMAGRGLHGHGRQKGVPNKVTTSLKEAILAASAEIGDKMHKRDIEREVEGTSTGIQRYLEHLASFESKSFASLLGRVLPIQVAGGEDNEPVKFLVSWLPPTKP